MNYPLSVFAKPRLITKMSYGLAAAVACVAIAAAATRPDSGPADHSPVVANAQEVSQAFTDVTKHAAPAVAFIKVEKQRSTLAPTMNHQRQNPFQDEFLKKFFGERMPEFDMPSGPGRAMGQGSGFVISSDGYILTNAHVVADADRVTVTLSDRREYGATIIGTDPSTDVAVIKIDAKDLPTLPMGNSDDLEVGEWVLAVGSPFGLSGTVTNGIVSATGRSSVGIADYENFIQTDAAINPGNSGGPLVNLRGEAIGINTAIFSRTGAFNGIGFAIPINLARNICDQLIEDGSVTRGFLGISIQELTPELAESFGLDTTAGVLVGGVTKDSPAERAGLETGDVIVEFDGKESKQVGPFRNRVAATAPESEVNLAVIRDGKREALKLIVGALPRSQAAHGATTSHGESLGFSVQSLSDDLKEQLGYADDAGVVVTDVDPDSQAAMAGIEAGMLIKQVNRQPIVSVGEFNKAVEQSRENNAVLLLVQKGKYSRYVALPLQK